MRFEQFFWRGVAMLLLAMGVLLVISMGRAAFGATLTRGVLNAEIDHGNVLVNAGCSGTVIAPSVVLTASHCVLDQFKDVEHNKVDPKTGKVTKETVRITVPGKVSQLGYVNAAISTQYSVVFKVTAIDRDVDLALLSLAAPLGSPVALSCVNLKRGDTVFAVGNPFGILYASLSKGIVGSVHRSYRDLAIAGQLGDATDNGDHGLIQHTALIAPGNSGGALLDANGNLVGVNVRDAQGFGFAVPLADVQAFLKANGESSLVTCGGRG